MARINSTNVDTIVGAAGQATLPNQPSFFGYRNANTAAVTGDGTAYTIVCTNEIYDIGNNYDLTTFVAPVTGKYKLDATVLLYNVAAAHTLGQFYIVTSSFTYFQRLDIGSICTVTTYATMNVSCLAAMTAGDTASMKITVSNGAKSILVIGGAIGNVDCGTYFSGILLS
jgi:hypothetical protein